MSKYYETIKLKIRISVFSAGMLLVLAAICSWAVEPSHYEAAVKLIDVTKKFSSSGFVDTIINQLIAAEPSLKEYKQEIDDVIRNYINSNEFRETKIQAVMYYFTEPEIVQITNKIKDPSFHASSKEQAGLVARYNKTFDILKGKFIEYIQRKIPGIVKKK